MNNIIPFDFNRSEVRVITDEHGDPWFILADICKVLDIKNPTQLAQRLDEDERAMLNIGRQGNATIINESGLYSVVLRSDKPEAKPFKRWVTHEVLPAIRKTGQYVAAPLSPAELIIAQGQALLAVEQEQARQAQQLTALERRLEMMDGDTGYLTVTAYARKHGWKIPLSQAKRIGQKVAKVAKDLGIAIGSVPDERWGKVNSYPAELLDEVAHELRRKDET